jgi:MFS family permease
MSSALRETSDQTDEKVALNATDSITNGKNVYEKNRTTKQNILKNLVIFCFSYLFQFSALNALSNLQTSLHGILGIATLLTSSIAFTVFCLFLPTLCKEYIGYKSSLICSNICISLFVLANFYPAVWSLIPAAVLVGAANAMLWTFNGTFISFLVSRYSQASKQKTEHILMRFFGIFIVIFQLSKE